MIKNLRLFTLCLCLSLFAVSDALAEQQLMSIKMAAANPCAVKAGNPCNPCNPGAKKKANPCNPCGVKSKGSMVDPKLVTRPAGTVLYTGTPRDELVKVGERLFSDSSLGTSGLTCNSCHSTDAMFKPSFAKPYPHKVAMAKEQTGNTLVHADEFVQFCVLVPLKGQPLAWESKELAALTAFTVDVKQKAFMQKHGVNPCNPCAVKGANPCNPCAAKGANPCNPCAVKGANPCNPCAVKGANPCNPCAVKGANPCNPCAKR